MKTTKLLSILLLLLIQQSCSKENNNSQSYNPQNFYFYLTAEQLNQTPYFTNPAFDTISFTSDKGDTLTFVKTKTDTSWYCERTTSNPDNNDQNCYQTLHNTYTTIKGNGSFDVKHWKRNSGWDTDFIDITIDNILFHIYESSINDTKAPNYLNLITISGKTFNKVHYFTNNNFKIFINKDYGIFSIDNTLNNTQFLITK
jgi:hypothetical protein